VTKASVTIVFNNDERSSSPVGYEQCDKITVTRQVVIGGRNKYLINGHNAQLQRVQNLFHSVQLNVNNPHFLIMQGRITKVLNMKPQEILGMIEEAAGTRMFESKKLAAIKLIDKKEGKVDEIKKVLAEEITPTLEWLRKERHQYLQWKNNQGEIEWNERIMLALQFHRAEQALASYQTNVEKLLQQLEKSIADSSALDAKLADHERELADAQRATVAADREAAALLAAQAADEAALDVAADGDEAGDDPADDPIEDADEAPSSKRKGGDKKRGAAGASAQQKKKRGDAAASAQAAPADALEALEQRVSQLAQQLAKHEATVAHRRETLANESKARDGVEKALRSGVSQGESLQAACAKADEELGAATTAHDDAANALSTLQRRYQAVSAGIAADADAQEAEKGSLAQQLRDAERVVAETKTALKQAGVTVKHLSGELKKRQASETRETGALDGLKREHAKLQAVADKHRADLQKLGFDEAREKQLTSRKSALLNEIQALSEQSERLAGALSHSQFTYQSPSAKFDRSKVKGLVADLVRVPDTKYAGALEVVAGAKLYNVVVEDENTGQQLLEKGGLKKRVTIIPLNKISARPVEGGKVQRAEQLVGKENVGTALSFVGYAPEVSAAMEYVFGSTLVCSDAGAAKTVAFDDAVKTKCVTLDGDSYDPAGTLTGGSRRNGGQLLSQLQALNECRDKLHALQAELAAVDGELAQLHKGAAAYRAAKQAFELAEHEASLVAARIGQNANHQAVEALRQMEAELEAAKASLETLATRERDALALCKQLEAQASAASASRAEQLASLDAELNAAKKAVNDAKKKLAQRQSAAEQARLEREAATVEARSLREQAAAAVTSIAEAEEALALAVAAHEAVTARAEATRGALEGERARRRAANKQLAQFEAARAKTLAERDQVALERKQLEHDRQRTAKARGELEAQIEAMLREHQWIAAEKQFFGKKNTDFDFAAERMTKIEQRLASLRELQEGLSRSINKKVMAMFEKAESEYQSLTEKKRIIEKDKEKIEAVIGELDAKKAEALRIVWNKVNKDFGSIFAALLPGASAKLEPPAGASFTEGLEIKVAFNDVWKNLAELSGGQRSLLALSLILALLLFKPAPMYILDEIDSALDLSHTQNIGTMLKNHFTHSQFIIVSLKEGMFQNANVLFRTKFVDGVSVVQRHVNRLTK
jgi:structural maintenance of chromosome 2